MGLGQPRRPRRPHGARSRPRTAGGAPGACSRAPGTQSCGRGAASGGEGRPKRTPSGPSRRALLLHLRSLRRARSADESEKHSRKEDDAHGCCSRSGKRIPWGTRISPERSPPLRTERVREVNLCKWASPAPLLHPLASRAMEGHHDHGKGGGHEPDPEPVSKRDPESAPAPAPATRGPSNRKRQRQRLQAIRERLVSVPDKERPHTGWDKRKPEPEVSGSRARPPEPDTSVAAVEEDSDEPASVPRPRMSRVEAALSRGQWRLAARLQDRVLAAVEHRERDREAEAEEFLRQRQQRGGTASKRRRKPVWTCVADWVSHHRPALHISPVAPTHTLPCPTDTG